ncbi:MAG: hypothetical protein DWQ36_01025 [Acidobacteria bacterium]|nr:MAG: hypothetical protein DWQ30_15115 [Acidobacteriota bacterium]REK11756.1 MAG: hypothetical protein DWQ36_01025 [Acidobacteriota bacterium]
MSAEERHLAVSEFLDRHRGESDLISLADRLASDPEARRFYRRARALDGLAAALDELPREEPPVEVWQRIAAETSVDAGPVRGWGRRPEASGNRLLLLAAAGLLAIAALSVLLLWPQLTGEPDEPTVESQLAEVEVGARAGEMDPARFFDLATEILEADRSYRRELLALMTAIEQELGSGEGDVEEGRRSDFSDRRSDPRARGNELEGGSSDGVRIEMY